MRERITKNLLSNYASNAVGLTLGFLLVPFLISKLGINNYGVIVIAEAAILLLEIVTTSVRVALSRHATFALAKGETQSFCEYLSTGRVLLFGVAGFAFAFGSALSLFFPQVFRVPVASAGDSKQLFFFVTLAVTLSIPNIAFWSVLYAKQRFDLINFSASFGLIVRALGIFAVYSALPPLYHTLSTYGVIYLMMTVAQNFIVFFFSRRLMPDLKIGLHAFRRECVGPIVSFSVHTVVGRAGTVAMTNAANFCINIFWGPSLNAVYAIAIKFPTMMRRIFLEASWSLTPTFTELLARHDMRRFERLLMFYSKTLSVVTTPISIALMLFARPIVHLWVGPDFDLAGRLLPICMLPLFLSLPFSVSACVMTAYAKVQVPSFVSFAMNVFNLALAVFLGVGLSYGVYGFAISTAVSSFLYLSLFSTYYACRLSGISLRKYWMEAFIKPVVPGIILFGAFVLVFGRVPEFGVVRLGSYGLICVIYYVLAVVVLFNAEEKKDISRFIEKLTGGQP